MTKTGSGRTSGDCILGVGPTGDGQCIRSAPTPLVRRRFKGSAGRSEVECFKLNGVEDAGVGVRYVQSVDDSWHLSQPYRSPLHLSFTSISPYRRFDRYLTDLLSPARFTCLMTTCQHRQSMSPRRLWIDHLPVQQNCENPYRPFSINQ